MITDDDGDNWAKADDGDPLYTMMAQYRWLEKYRPQNLLIEFSENSVNELTHNVCHACPANQVARLVVNAAKRS